MKPLNEYGSLLKHFLIHKNITIKYFHEKTNRKTPTYLYMRSEKKLTETVIIDTISTMQKLSNNSEQDADFIFKMKRYHIRFLMEKLQALTKYKDKIVSQYSDECNRKNYSYPTLARFVGE